MALTIASGAFREGDTIPVKYTCKGQGVSPELKWSGDPGKTTSFVIIAEDPDAPPRRLHPLGALQPAKGRY
jgi:phosphatidylethanolamine-binding protein (PEBP) family uncharacterized protein